MVLSFLKIHSFILKDREGEKERQIIHLLIHFSKWLQQPDLGPVKIRDSGIPFVLLPGGGLAHFPLTFASTLAGSCIGSEVAGFTLAFQFGVFVMQVAI